MSKLAIVYHSAHGHTEFIARQVHAGASEIDGIDAHLVKAEDIARTPDELVGYDGVSSLPSGDKQSTLLSMFVFSMQHGMLWVGNPILPEQHSGVPYDEAANRLGSWSGLMAQAGHAAPADSFVPGDVKTARMFGRHFAQSLDRVMVPA